MRLTAHYYRYHEADPALDVPAEGHQGWATKTVEVPRDQSALICMHFWNFGLDDRLPYRPEAPLAGWYRVQEYVSRMIPITRDIIPPLLAAARAHNLPVVHMANLPNLRNCPGYTLAQQTAGPEPERADGAPRPPSRQEFEQGRLRDVYGAHNPPNDMGDVSLIDFPPQARPLDEEPVVISTHQLNAVCRQRDIWHLIYCGFCVNDCIQTSPGGMVDMTRLGYACSIIRDATTAAEYRETARAELAKQIALCKVSVTSGYVFESADLIAALADA